MAIREIRVVPDPVLRTPCDPIKEITPAVRHLVQDLLDTVDDPGRAGLSANQIGVNLRAFSYNINGKIGYVLNPVLEETSGEQYGDEGCLSVPGLWYKTRRADYARVRGIDLEGKTVVLEGRGIMGRMLQHETDHLNGHVYLDRLEKEERREAMRYMRNHHKCLFASHRYDDLGVTSLRKDVTPWYFMPCVPSGEGLCRESPEPPNIVNRHTTNSRHVRDDLCRSADAARLWLHAGTHDQARTDRKR